MPTPWSSRCSNDARRSACAARSAPPAGTSAPSSSPESLLLSALGGAGGALLGIAVTTGYAAHQHWPAVVPLWATTGGLLATLLIGATAGIYPAWRAARMPPTDALTTP